MSQIDEVSLGFAEFVAQLLAETFDATLSAQTHQIEKYAELLASLELSTSDFYSTYLHDDESETAMDEKDIERLVDERKSMLQALMQRSELPRLHVDSGEIRAKMELSNVYESSTSDAANNSQKNKQTRGQNIRANGVRQFHDAKTNKTTLLIDKNAINHAASIAGLRMAVSPAAASTSNNLCSEIIIKFKMI